MKKSVNKFSDLIMFKSGTANGGFSVDEQKCPKRILSLKDKLFLFCSILKRANL